MALSVFLLSGLAYGQGEFLESLPITVPPHEMEPDYASTSCTIQNMQGNIAGGNISIFGVPSQGAWTYVDPAGSGGSDDPGCFYSDPYPFQVEEIEFQIFSSGAFGGIEPSEGVGTFSFIVLMVEATGSEACPVPGGDLLYSSDVNTLEITADEVSYAYIEMPDFEVDGPFFVHIACMDWSGAPDRAPSAVLWDANTPPDCRMYWTLLDMEGEPQLADNNDVFVSPGWFNVTVRGTVAEQSGDVDIAVSDLTTPPMLTVATPASISATVSNVGTAQVAGVEVSLSANGVQVATQSLNLDVGDEEEVTFSYTPGSSGDVTLMVTADAEGDIDTDNNSVSTTVTVEALEDPCLFFDDMESYELGPLVDQSDNWVLWNPNVPAMDVEVTDEQAFSGSQSVKIIGDPDDVNFNLGNQTVGTWRIGFYVYIPSGNGGYWNIQKTQTPGQEWAMQVFMQNDGSGSVDAGGVNAATFAYEQDAWVECALVVNLDANVANLYIDEEWVFQWPWTWTATSAMNSLSSIGAINFYPEAVPNPLMYVDDVSFCDWYNDAPCQAFDLVLNQSIEGDNSNASPWNPDLAGDAEDCWTEDPPAIDNDVWYTFTVPADGTYLVSTNLSLLENDNTQILVYSSSDDTCEGELTAIACGEDVNMDNQLTQVLLSDLEEGQVIWILVDGWNGSSGTFQIGVFDTEPPANDDCDNAFDLNALTGGDLGSVINSQTFSNLLASGQEEVPFCFEDGDVGQSLWFSFTGDGNTYFISTNDCGGDIDYVPFGDTQMAIYTGECDMLEEVGCNEDIDLQGGNFAAGLTFDTEPGVEYLIMIDSWENLVGEYCISFENLGDGTATENSEAALQWNLFPNPAGAQVQLECSEPVEYLNVYNVAGQLVEQISGRQSERLQFDVSALASGMYMVQIIVDGKPHTRKLTVQ